MGNLIAEKRGFASLNSFLNHFFKEKEVGSAAAFDWVIEYDFKNEFPVFPNYPAEGTHKDKPLIKTEMDAICAPDTDVFKKFVFFKTNETSSFDCDGCGEGIDNGKICTLSRDIYKTLWKWEAEETKKNAKGNEYTKEFKNFASCVLTSEQGEPFELGPDTMNSGILPLKHEFVFNEIKEKYKNGSIKKFEKYLLWLIRKFEREKIIFKLENHVETYLQRIHSIGNFVLVPAHFNLFRTTMVNDYWDLSLSLLKYKNGTWTYKAKKPPETINWDKELFTKYINTFFLWDYVYEANYNEYGIRSLFTDYYTVPDSHTLPLLQGGSIAPQSHAESIAFFRNANRAIARRSVFMTAMLVIATQQPALYEDLCNKIFLTNSIYDGYQGVFTEINKLLGTESNYTDLLSAAQKKIESL